MTIETKIKLLDWTSFLTVPCAVLYLILYICAKESVLLPQSIAMRIIAAVCMTVPLLLYELFQRKHPKHSDKRLKFCINVTFAILFCTEIFGFAFFGLH